MVTSRAEEQLIDLARQVLFLEQQVDAYQRLLDEELEEMRHAVSDCRKKLLMLLSAGEERPLGADRAAS